MLGKKKEKDGKLKRIKGISKEIRNLNQ